MRGAIHKIHLWIGLILFLPLILSAITGGIMVFHNEIFPAFQEKSALSINHYSAAKIIDKAKKSVPENYFLSVYKSADGSGKAAMVRFNSKNKSDRPQTIYVNPFNLEIVKNDEDQGIFRQIFLLHSTLLMRDYGGKNIIGWCGVALLIMSLSGLIIWWPKLNKLKSSLTFKISSKGFIFHRDLHKALGIWGFIFLTITSFSGIYLAFPKPVGNMIGKVFPAQDLRGADIIIENSHHQKPIAIDKIIVIADKVVNSENIAAIFIPSKPDAPYRVNFFPPDYKKDQPLISVFINQYDGSIIKILDPKNYSVGESITSRLHAIHAGQSFGLVWSVVVFFVAFLPPVFAFTGIKMWLLKRRGKKIDPATSAG